MLAAVLGLAGCSGGAGSRGSGKFSLTIGNIVPLTGELRDFGAPGEKAATLAVQQIRQAIRQVGLQQTVELQNEDEQTDAGAATRAARKLSERGASCIAGAWAAPDTVQVSRLVTKPDRILQISPASTGTDITTLSDSGFLSRTAPPDSLQGPALAGAIATELGGASGRTINVGARNDTYGRGLSAYFERAWKSRGGKIGQTVKYEPGAPSYNSEAERMVSGNPDAWVIVDFPETYQRFGPALVKTGKWDPRRSFFTDGLASSSLPSSIGTAATEGMRGTSPGTPHDGATQLAFDRLYASAAPRSVRRQTFDAQNFDAVVLCYLAAVSAGRADGTAMKDRLRDIAGPPGTKYTWQQLPQAVKALADGKDIDYEGASGPINLDDKGDPTQGFYDILQFKHGTLVPIRQIPVGRGG